MWQHGDLLVFGGTGAIGRAIRWLTWSRYSHIAAMGIRPYSEEQWLVYEATGLVDEPCQILHQTFVGFQAQDPAYRVDEYPGRIWRMRLKEMWNFSYSEKKRWHHLLNDFVGVNYDLFGAILAGSRLLKRLPWFGADASTLFCSEAIAFVLQRLQRLPLRPAGWWTPASLVRDLTRLGVYNRPELIHDGR